MSYSAPSAKSALTWTWLVFIPSRTGGGGGAAVLTISMFEAPEK